MSPKHFNNSVVKNVESIDKSHSGGDRVCNKLTREETNQPKYSREQVPVSWQTMGYYTYPHIHQQGEECKIHEGNIFSNLECSESHSWTTERNTPSICPVFHVLSQPCMKDSGTKVWWQ